MHRNVVSFAFDVLLSREWLMISVFLRGPVGEKSWLGKFDGGKGLTPPIKATEYIPTPDAFLYLDTECLYFKLRKSFMLKLMSDQDATAISATTCGEGIMSIC